MIQIIAVCQDKSFQCVHAYKLPVDKKKFTLNNKYGWSDKIY